MKVTRLARTLSVTCNLFLLPIASSLEAEDTIINLPGSGIIASAADLPSALWPQFVTTTEAIQVDNKEIKVGYRGTLQRCELDMLVIDFGRYGVARVSPLQTDFYDTVGALMRGETKKQYPNLTLQVGNKMMTFGRGEKSGGFKLEEIADTRVYLLIYLDTYDPEQAEALHSFGEEYTRIQEANAGINAIILANDRDYYNFGYTIGYNVPFIVPHFREGYIQSFGHNSDKYPHMVLVDPNGKILLESDVSLDFHTMGSTLETWIDAIQN